jgi:hypothetical protein
MDEARLPCHLNDTVTVRLHWQHLGQHLGINILIERPACLQMARRVISLLCGIFSRSGKTDIDQAAPIELDP